MKQTPFLTIGLKDGIKGLITAIITALLTGAYSILDHGGLPTPAEWKTIAFSSIAAGVSYLLKNYLTNSEDKILKQEPIKIE